MKRYAIIFSDSSQIDAYMPGNYSVIWRGEFQDESMPARYNRVTVIAGEDNAGWTLDSYVLPRLASGMYVGREIDLSHPVMKLIPDSNMAPCPRCGKQCRIEKFGTWTAHCSQCMRGFKVER